MLRLVQDAGVFHGYMENEVFSPEVIKVAEMVASGALGRVLTMRAREGHSGPHAEHFWDAETAGGGAFLDMGCHCIEAARYIIGKDVRIARGLRLGRDARPRRQDDRRGQRHRDPPLRGRPHGHDRGVVDGQGRDRGPQRGLLRARADRPRPRLDADPGLPAGVGRVPGREDRRRHGLGLPGRRRAAGGGLRRADAPLRRRPTATASSRARPSRTGSSSTASSTPPIGRWPADAGKRSRSRPCPGRLPDDRAGHVRPRARVAARGDGPARRASRRPRPTRSRRPASGAPRRSPRAVWSTASGPAIRASRSRSCSPATARIPGSTRWSSCP